MKYFWFKMEISSLLGTVLTVEIISLKHKSVDICKTVMYKCKTVILSISDDFSIFFCDAIKYALRILLCLGKEINIRFIKYELISFLFFSFFLIEKVRFCNLI